MNQAAATEAPDTRALLARIPAGGLWLAANLLLLLALVLLAAWLLWGRQPPVVERILPAPPAELAPGIQARAAALAAEIEALSARIAAERNAALAFTCPPGQVLRPEAAPAAAE